MWLLPHHYQTKLRYDFHETNRQRELLTLLRLFHLSHLPNLPHHPPRFEKYYLAIKTLLITKSLDIDGKSPPMHASSAHWLTRPTPGAHSPTPT